MLDDIRNALRGGDSEAAEAAARALIANEPGNAEAHHLLGLALRQRGDAAGAALAIDRALVLAPEHAGYHVSRAMLALQQSDAAAARASLREATRQDPNELLAYIALAELALQSSDLDQAEQQLRYAERINPDHPHVLAQRGQLELARGKPEAAIATLSRAAEAAPQDALVQGSLGLALLAQRHYAFAEQALNNALALQPQARSLRFALVQSLLQQQRGLEAEAQVDMLLAERGDDPHALTLKAQLATLRGAHDAALVAVSESLRRVPEQPRALQTLLANWTALAHPVAEARATLEDLVVRAPRFDAAWGALLDLWRGDAAGSIEVVARWRAAMPDSPTAAEVAAQVAEAQGDFATASELAQIAVAREPGRIRAQLILVREALRAQQPAQARTRIEALLPQVNEANARRALAAWLGRACDAAGDPAAAVAAWGEAHAFAAGAPAYPALASRDAARAAAAGTAQAPDAAATDAGATLLWGAPGSGVERVAALLRAAQLVVLDDRFTATPRDDGFRLDAADQGDDAARPGSLFAQRWRAGLAAIGADATVIDWLPHWDARWLAPLRHGLPGTRLIVALRDPRDMLLHWLAFGSPQRLGIANLHFAAEWLAHALAQFADLPAAAEGGLRVIRVDIDRDDDATMLRTLTQSLHAAQSPSSEALRQVQGAIGDLPMSFPAGHWQRYAEVLHEPFALLEPIAARLAG